MDLKEIEEKVDELKKEIDALRPVDAEMEKRIMQKFRLDWNYHSNNLEGNSLTFGETKSFLLHGITAEGKPLKDHLDLKGHNEAILMLDDVIKNQRPLTETFLREIHEIILHEPYDRPAITADGKPTTKRIEIGQYKKTANHVKTVTGEIFYFATPEETPAKMNDLMDWYAKVSADNSEHPLVIAAEFHYKFIRIHPFDDGNGRMARILMNLILMKYGYPPVIVKTGEKTEYFRALKIADGGDESFFVAYIGEQLIRSLNLFLKGTKGESIEDIDDLDKEIALLEQRLNTFGKRIKTIRSKDSILEIYDNSVTNLAKKMIEECEKFDKFYAEVKFHVWVDSSSAGVGKYDMVADNRSQVKDETHRVALSYNFRALRQLGFGEFGHQSFIEIQFSTTGYKIVFSDASSFPERAYGEQLTSDEINNFVKVETRKHKEMIEAKLNQIENKKN